MRCAPCSCSQVVDRACLRQAGDVAPCRRSTRRTCGRRASGTDRPRPRPGRRRRRRTPWWESPATPACTDPVRIRACALRSRTPRGSPSPSLSAKKLMPWRPARRAAGLVPPPHEMLIGVVGDGRDLHPAALVLEGLARHRLQQHAELPLGDRTALVPVDAEQLELLRAGSRARSTYDTRPLLMMSRTAMSSASRIGS